ncbi:Holliday junction branch migration protein RuvA [Gryllotalpicola koreensis]|uniref:Holliday junction branch migration complex subunit RuvA n=1 Tax=Gryllotalpicola koreensis TaxID=993086 RepID=A0ABP7ZWV9_9MICO
MISSLRGTVLRASGAELVIEVSGVGYLVSVTPEHALSLRVGDEALLHTALIVREDALSLFGFADAEQLDVFQLLLGVNGVGPKSALGVLAVMTPDQIAAAVQNDDDAAFRKVSGIGPKTAKLIVVQLAGKLHAVAPAAVAPAAKQKPTVGDDVRVALVGLGWPEKVAADAVAEVLAELGDAAADATAASVPALLRRALALLGPAPQHQPAGAGR